MKSRPLLVGRDDALSLPVRGAWVEMLCAELQERLVACRSPCGERGLKFIVASLTQATQVSLPVRGAWVEILAMLLSVMLLLSLPVRGAWVEMCCATNFERRSVVAPRAGSVG